MKNKFKHNADGTTHIFLEKKNGYQPGKYVAVIDTDDWHKVKDYRWRVDIKKPRGNSTRPQGPYVQTSILHPDGTLIERTDQNGKRPRQTGLLLHHLIMGKPGQKMMYDHINHNGLDNRKENLRQVTHAQNMRNSRKRATKSTSKYKGVCWLSREKRWLSSINLEGKTKMLGYFSCEICAAAAYDRQALESHGEFAKLNGTEPCASWVGCKKTRAGRRKNK